MNTFKPNPRLHFSSPRMIVEGVIFTINSLIAAFNANEETDKNLRSSQAPSVLTLYQCPIPRNFYFYTASKSTPYSENIISMKEHRMAELLMYSPPNETKTLNTIA